MLVSSFFSCDENPTAVDFAPTRVRSHHHRGLDDIRLFRIGRLTFNGDSPIEHLYAFIGTVLIDTHIIT